MSTKQFRCRGSFIQGTACGNDPELLPEGVKSCARCTEKKYDKAAKKAAKDAEKERTKDLPADRVKKSQSITIK